MQSPWGIRDLMVLGTLVYFWQSPPVAGAVPSQILRLTHTGLDAGEASATQFTALSCFSWVWYFAAIMLIAKFRFFSSIGDIVILNLVVFGNFIFSVSCTFVICLYSLSRNIGNWSIIC